MKSGKSALSSAYLLRDAEFKLNWRLLLWIGLVFLCGLAQATIPTPTPTPCVQSMISATPSATAVITLNGHNVTGKTIRLQYQANKSWSDYGFGSFYNDTDTLFCPADCNSLDSGHPIGDTSFTSLGFSPALPPTPGAIAVPITLTANFQDQTGTPPTNPCTPANAMSASNDGNPAPSCTVILYDENTQPPDGDDNTCFLSADPSPYPPGIRLNGYDIPNGSVIYLPYNSTLLTPEAYGFSGYGPADGDTIHAWTGSQWETQLVSIPNWTSTLSGDFTTPGIKTLTLTSNDSSEGPISPTPLCTPDSLEGGRDASQSVAITVVLVSLPFPAGFIYDALIDPRFRPRGCGGSIGHPIDLGSGNLYEDITDLAIPIKRGMNLLVSRHYSSQGFINERNADGTGMIGYNTSGNWHLDPYDSRIEKVIWNERGSNIWEDHVLGYIDGAGNNIYFDYVSGSTTKISDTTAIHRLRAPNDSNAGQPIWISRFEPVKAGFAPNNFTQAIVKTRQIADDVEMFVLHSYATSNVTVPAQNHTYSTSSDLDPDLSSMGVAGYVVRYMKGAQYIYDANGGLRFIDQDWRNNVPIGLATHVDDYLEVLWGTSGSYGATDRVRGVTEGCIPTPSTTTGRMLLFHYNAHNAIDHIDMQAGTTVYSNLVRYDYCDTGSNTGKLFRVKPYSNDAAYATQYDYGMAQVTGNNAETVSSVPAGMTPALCMISQVKLNSSETITDQIKLVLTEYDYTKLPLRAIGQWFRDPQENFWRKAFTIENGTASSTFAYAVTHESGQKWDGTGRYDGKTGNATDKPRRSYLFNANRDLERITYSGDASPLPQTRNIYIAGTRLIDKVEMLVSSSPDHWVTVKDFSYENDASGIARLTSIVDYTSFDPSTYISDNPLTTLYAWHSTFKDHPVSISFADGRRTLYSYDSVSGRLTSEEHQRLNFQTGAYSTFETLSYFANLTTENYAQLASVTIDPAGSDAPTKSISYTYYPTTNYSAYEISGMVGGIVFDQRPFTYTYNPFGQVKQIVENRGTTTFKYSGESGETDAFYPPRQTQEVDVAGNITRYEYNDHEMIHYIDEAVGTGLQRRTTLGYDQWDHLVLHQSAEDGGQTADTTYIYDIYGNLVHLSDPVGNITTNSYDEHDRLKQVKRYGTTIGTPVNTVSYAYTTGFSSGCGSCAGADSNLIAQRTISNGTNIENLYFKYDLAGRMVQQGTTSDANDIIYNYSPSRARLIEIDHGSSLYGNQKLTYSYDEYNRLAREYYPNDRFVEYLYDTAGRLKSVKDPFGNINTIAYDTDSRLGTLSHSTLGTATFNYGTNTVDDLLQRLTLGNGAYTDYTYDSHQRLKIMDHYEKPSGVAARLLKLEWGYDALQRKDATEGIALTSSHIGANDKLAFTYDTADRLTQERLTDGTTNAWEVQHGYDKAENRTGLTNPVISAALTYGAQNREATALVNANSRLQSYDFKGNVTVRPPLAGGDSYNYTWDAYNRLRSVARTGQTTVNYDYDALGRLIRRKQGAETLMYYYLGQSQIAEERGGNNDTIEPGRNQVVDRPESGSARGGWGVYPDYPELTMPDYAYEPDQVRGTVLRLSPFSAGGLYMLGDADYLTPGNSNGSPWHDSVHRHLSMWYKEEAGGTQAAETSVLFADSSGNEKYLHLKAENGTNSWSGYEGTYYLGSGYKDNQWHYLELDLHAIIQSVSGGSFTLGTINGLMVSTPEADLYLDDIVLSGGELEKAYQLVPGAALAGTLAMQNANGAKTYFQYNDLGTVLAQTDGSAAKNGVWVPDFEGNYRYASAGSPARPALGLTGKPYDPAAALYYFGARWLDTERGRWVSEEPLGLDGPNLYHFLRNRFNGHFDPDGLESEELTGEDLQKNNWNSSYENGTGAGLFDNIYQTINSTINDALNSVKSFFGFDGGNRPGPRTAELASTLLAGAELGSIKVAGTACKVGELEGVSKFARIKKSEIWQNKQFEDAMRHVGGMTKKQREKFHRLVSHENYSWKELTQVAEDVKNGIE